MPTSGGALCAQLTRITLVLYAQLPRITLALCAQLPRITLALCAQLPQIALRVCMHMLLPLATLTGQPRVHSRRWEEEDTRDAASLEVAKVMGQGAFGTVYLVKHKRYADRYYALKCLDKRQVIKHNWRAVVLREKEILASLPTHPCVIALYQTFQDEVRGPESAPPSVRSTQAVLPRLGPSCHVRLCARPVCPLAIPGAVLPRLIVREARLSPCHSCSVGSSCSWRSRSAASSTSFSRSASALSLMPPASTALASSLRWAICTRTTSSSATSRCVAQFGCAIGALGTSAQHAMSWYQRAACHILVVARAACYAVHSRYPLPKCGTTCLPSQPENLMISSTGYLKLIDMGFAKLVAPGDKTYTLCGTPYYLAPEMIKHKGHDKAVDWWTLGVLTYEMLDGEPAFQGNSEIEVYAKITRLQYSCPSFFSGATHATSRLAYAQRTHRLDPTLSFERDHSRAAHRPGRRPHCQTARAHRREAPRQLVARFC